MNSHMLAVLVHLLLVCFITKHRSLTVDLEYSLCILTD